METTRARFEFMSEGETLVGNLFLPEGSKPAGVVVAVGPLTSVKEQAAGAYARAMAERGYAAARIRLSILRREQRRTAAVRKPRRQHRGHQERSDCASRR